MQLHTYGSHLNQRKKNPWQNTWKKNNHGSHLVNTRGGHLVFPNQPKKIPRQVVPMMNLSCKFGSSSYNILRDRKVFVKTWQTDARTDGRTHGQRAFYHLPYQAYRPAGDNKYRGSGGGIVSLSTCISAIFESHIIPLALLLVILHLSKSHTVDILVT